MHNHNSAAAETLLSHTPAGGDQELLTDDPRGAHARFSGWLRPGPACTRFCRTWRCPTRCGVVQLPGQRPGLLGGATIASRWKATPALVDFRVTSLDLPANDGHTVIHNRQALLHRLNRSNRRSASPLAGLPGTSSCGCSIPRKSAMFRRVARAARLRACTAVINSAKHAPGAPARGKRSQRRRCLRRMYNSQMRTGIATAAFRHAQLIPPSDQAFSALIEDLQLRACSTRR